MKILEFKRSGIRIIVEFRRIPSRFPNQVQHQHVDALLAALQEVIDLIAALPKDVIALSTMTEGMDDQDMHKYGDERD